MTPHSAEHRTGLLYGLAAYTAWGLVPAYFKLLSAVDPLYVLGHRVLWSVVLLIPMVTFRGLWPEFRLAIRDPRMLAALLASTVMVSINWYTFVSAVGAGRVLETSLGYYINPLVVVALGVVFLKERLRPLQLVSVTLGTIAVVVLSIAQHHLPRISLVLAISFAMYGFIRKLVKIEPVVGLFVETLILLPPALAVLWYFERSGAAFAASPMHITGHYLLLSAAGVITAIPLIWFAKAARRLPLAMLGLLQYLAPSCAFLLAVIFYGERMTGPQTIAFPMIWLALAIFSADSLMALRRHEPVDVPATDLPE